MPQTGRDSLSDTISRLLPFLPAASAHQTTLTSMMGTMYSILRVTRVMQVPA